METIKCFENYIKLRSMFLRGIHAELEFYTNHLNISQRTFQRLINYLKQIDNIIVVYDKNSNTYKLE